MKVMKTSCNKGNASVGDGAESVPEETMVLFLFVLSLVTQSHEDAHVGVSGFTPWAPPPRVFHEELLLNHL